MNYILAILTIFCFHHGLAEQCDSDDTDIFKLGFEPIAVITNDAANPIQSTASDSKNYFYVQKPFSVTVYDKNLKFLMTHKFERQIFGELTTNLKGEVVVFDGDSLLHKFSLGGTRVTSKPIVGFKATKERIATVPKFLRDGSMIFATTDGTIVKIVDGMVVELTSTKLHPYAIASFSLFEDGSFLIGDCGNPWKTAPVLHFNKGQHLLKNRTGRSFFGGCERARLVHPDGYYISLEVADDQVLWFAAFSSDGNFLDSMRLDINKIDTAPIFVDEKIFYVAHSRLNFLDRDAIRKSFFSLASRKISLVDFNINITIPMQVPLVVEHEGTKYILLSATDKLLAYNKNGELVTLADVSKYHFSEARSLTLLGGDTVLQHAKNKIMAFKFGRKKATSGCDDTQDNFDRNDEVNVENVAIEQPTQLTPTGSIEAERFD